MEFGGACTTRGRHPQSFHNKVNQHVIFALHFRIQEIDSACFCFVLGSSETNHLALLIEERDEILENLEIAETKYINSFKLSTPDPSIADFYPSYPPPNDQPQSTSPKPEISRPRPLGNQVSGRIVRPHAQYWSLKNHTYSTDDDDVAGIRRSARPRCLRRRT